MESEARGNVARYEKRRSSERASELRAGVPPASRSRMMEEQLIGGSFTYAVGSSGGWKGSSWAGAHQRVSAAGVAK